MYERTRGEFQIFAHARASPRENFIRFITFRSVSSDTRVLLYLNVGAFTCRNCGINAVSKRFTLHQKNKLKFKQFVKIIYFCPDEQVP